MLHQKVPRGTTRRIWQFARPYRRLLRLFALTVLFDAAIVVVVPLALRAIIDTGIPEHRDGLILGLSIAIGVLAVADSLLSLGQRYITAFVGEGLVRDMRVAVFDHVQQMPFAFFVRSHTGALISRLTTDVLGAQTALTDLLSNVVGNLVLVAFVLVVMFTLSWQITLAALVILPLFAWPARIMGRRLGSLTRERYHLSGAMTSAMAERFNVGGALLVKLFGDPERERREFADRSNRVRDVGVEIALVGRVFAVALTATAAVATALVYGWGGILASRGELAIGTLVALAAYLARLYVPLTGLLGANVDVMTTLVSFERIFEVLDAHPDVTEAPDAVALPRGPTTVSFHHVDFSYGPTDGGSLLSLQSEAEHHAEQSTPVLDDVSFTADPGQLVALVGPTGAGKTTMALLVARLYDASAGSVTFDGIDVRRATLESLRAKIGVVAQDAYLFHETLRRNLSYARPEASGEEVDAAVRQAGLSELVATLPSGLDTVVGDRGYRLSGGQKQLVALARLILKAPDVVVLDEATAHLDAHSERAVQEAFETVLAGRTSIVIAHRLATVRRADVVLVVQRGRVVQRGTHDELLAAGGLYADLFRTQFAPMVDGDGDNADGRVTGLGG